MPTGVYTRSSAHREAVRQQRLGTTLTLEARQKISASNLRRYASNPSLKDQISKALTGKPKSAEHVEKVRRANLGKTVSAETRRKQTEAHLGQKLSTETRAKLSECRLKEWAEGRRVCTFSAETRAKVAEKARQRCGDKHPRWIADRAKLARKSADRSVAAVTWSSAVKRRDKHACALSYLGQEKCSGRLEAHHIYSWKSSPELRFDVSNGITLCAGHHPRKRAEELRLVPVFEELVHNRKD